MKPFLPFALLAAALGACRSTPPTTYHLLQPLELDAESAETAPGRLVALSIERFPAYLERVQLVRESAPGTLAVWESHAWAEPLDEGFGRVLAEDLSLLLDRPVVLAGPMTRPPRADLAIELEVSRFDVRASGVVELVATWTATDAEDGTVVPPRRSRVTVPLDGKGPDAVVAASSTALEELARRLAVELAPVGT
jgi:uncharacterized lipoprotein YmbA